MIDLKNLESYRENNRIEAKKALGGFPQSVWETYSAFANTLGGIILLGVEERRDHSLHAVNLPAPEKLVNELWDTLNNPAKVSVNVLTSSRVSIETVDGKRIIVISVPRAQRYDRPVYIGGNALGGAYRRNGEGDYRCTQEEIDAMLRDAALRTPDMQILGDCGLDVLTPDSVHRYRRLMESCRPAHAWQKLSDDDFLLKLGAAGRGADKILRPTAAGLLMFGNVNEILKKFPDYSLTYRDDTEEISSASGNWSGNILDFYLSVREKIIRNIAVPPSAEHGKKIDFAPVYKALREALANCLVNADYYGKQGIEIVKGKDLITFSNPGGFRIDVERAKTGGVSDPRNVALVKMFNLISVGDGNGSGIPHIYAVWERHGWLTPSISESFSPERITLSLAIGKGKGEKTEIKSGVKTLAQKAAIVEYLTDHASGSEADLCAALGLRSARVKELTGDLLAAGIIDCDEVNGGLVYRLKR